MFRLSRRSLCAAAAAAALSVHPVDEARAQEGVTELDPVTVTAPRAGTLTAPSVEEAREAIQRTPGGVSLVPAEEFRESRAATVKDMLDYVPGVFAQPKFGEDSRLAIRGSGLSRNFHLRGIRLLQDGIPINTADGGGDFQEIDPLALRYVEVFRGANALEYGSATLGGAVNLVTPTGRDASLFQGRAELGSFGFRRFQASSGQTLGAFDYFATPTQIHSDGFREHSREDAWRLNANVGYRFGEAAETRFYFGYNNIDQEMPGSLSKEDALNNPRSSPAVNFLNDYHRDIESVRLANRTSFLLGDLQVTVGGYFFDKNLYHPIFQVLDNHFIEGGGFAKAAGEGTLLGHRNRFVFGGLVNRGVNHDKRYVNVGGSRGRLTFDTDETAFNVELYGENQFFVLPQLATVTGLQAAYASREAKDNFLADGDQSADFSYTNLNPKLGLLWEPDEATQFFANVSRSAEPPTFSELNPTIAPGVPSLKAQRAITVELGSRGRRDRVAWDIALYRSWVRDELQNFTLPDGRSFTLNADKTIHQGVELGLEVTVLRNLFVDSNVRPDLLSLRQAYTFSDFRFDGDPTFGDNELPGAPRHYFRGELLYRHPDGFYLGPNIEWVPEAYFVDNANTLKTDPYVLVGFRAGWDFGNGLSLFLDARNLADERYISSVSVVPVATPANSAVFFPGDGRGVFAGVEYRW